MQVAGMTYQIMTLIALLNIKTTTVKGSGENDCSTLLQISMWVYIVERPLII